MFWLVYICTILLITWIAYLDYKKGQDYTLLGIVTLTIAGLIPFINTIMLIVMLFVHVDWDKVVIKGKDPEEEKDKKKYDYS
jgi:predicted ABC-type exoprotein transport system permease subunit